jgi:hypothetical protein
LGEKSIPSKCSGSYQYAPSDSEVKEHLKRAGCESVIEE